LAAIPLKELTAKSADTSGKTQVVGVSAVSTTRPAASRALLGPRKGITR
jgi:hypothetical protein